MVSKLRTTIVSMCAVLLLVALVMPHTAEADGFRVTRTTGIDNVIEAGNNQLIPKVHLILGTGDEQPIDRVANADLTVTVKFGDLPIIQATAWADPDTNTADDEGPLPTPIKAFDEDTADVQWKWSSGAKAIEIFFDSAASAVTGNYAITFADLRLDVSSLDDGDKVPIMVTSASGAGTVGLGSGSGSGSVSDNIATAKDGLTVAAAKAQDLSCGTPVAEGLSVTVTEGFGQAWSMEPAYRLMGQSAADNDDVSGAVAIRLEVTGLPTGAMIKWPDTVHDTRKDTSADTALPNKDTNIATLSRDKENSSKNGMFVIYTYADADIPTDPGTETGTDDDTYTGTEKYLADSPRTFKIEGIEIKNFGAAADINVMAQLWPMAKRNSDGKKNAADLKGTLSFEHALEAPKFADDAREGAWLVVSECVTYLLYPFVTCGATAGWSTGISVSNTSKDAGAFGAFDKTTEQEGSVTLYGFPRGDGAETVMQMVRNNLAAGDTYTFDCSTGGMAGMEGYAIIKANFQHARGMAFVLGNFADGAGVDVSHGYMAEVITNPTKRTDALQ